jgi:hypothetical protein
MTYSVPLFDTSPVSNVIGLKNCFQVIKNLPGHKEPFKIQVIKNPLKYRS